MGNKKKLGISGIFMLILGGLFLLSLLFNFIFVAQINSLNQKIDELQDPVLGFLSGKLQIWKAKIIDTDGKLAQQLLENPYKTERDNIMKSIQDVKKEIEKIKKKKVRDWKKEYRNMVIQFNELENMVTSYVEKIEKIK